MWLALSAGCSQPKPLVSDPNEAKTILNQMLSAWVQGESPDAQTSRTPPIYVADEKWLAGTKLTKFTIQGDGEIYGPSIRFPVTLEFEEGSGPREVFYLVSTKPSISVALGD